MVERIQGVKNISLGEFYRAMDTFLLDAIKPLGGYELIELQSLFMRFADEFMETFINNQDEK
jgi:hypothetical protein